MDDGAPPCTATLRADYRQIAALYGDKRSAERLIAHYLTERHLADGLRRANKQERLAGAYNHVYDTLLTEIRDHPRTTVARAPKPDYAARQAKMMLRDLSADDVFLDLGGGDCAVALAVAPHVAKSIVVDVSDQLVPTEVTVPNFKFVKNAGADIPLPDASVSFAYSNQVTEHLVKEDAQEQALELYRILKPGGRYLCRTPSAVTGPHDISMYFDDVARGTHMQEYTYASLRRLLTDAGFVRPRIIVAPRAYRLLTLPYAIARALEVILAAVPRSLHTHIARSKPARALLGITMMVEKPA